jgi:hypothetical protein
MDFASTTMIGTRRIMKGGMGDGRTRTGDIPNSRRRVFSPYDSCV